MHKAKICTKIKMKEKDANYIQLGGKRKEESIKGFYVHLTLWNKKFFHETHYKKNKFNQTKDYQIKN